MRLFIGNLGRLISAEELHQLFSGYGRVLEVTVPTDEEDQPKGYGYVTMEAQAAKQALTKVDRKRFKCQFLSVSEALYN